MATDVMSRVNKLDVEGEARVYRAFRHFWHPVLYAHELTDRPRQAFLCGEQLVVVRLGDEVCAFADLCAHRGSPLSLGTIENCELRCVYHGWQYNAAGHCTFIPQKPELSTRIHARIKKYPAVERYGLIWVSLVDNPRFPLPEFPEYDDPALGLEKIFLPAADWRCSPPRRTENYTDLGHFAILHDGVLGFRDKPQVPDHRVWQEPNALRMELLGPTFLVPNNPRYAPLKLGSEILHIHRQWWLFMPLTVLVRETGPRPQDVFCLFFHPTPIGPNMTRNFTVAARNYLTEKNHMEELARYTLFVYDQDQPVVEAQRPQQLPEDLSEELHLKGVDTLSVLYRRWLVQLAKEVDGTSAASSARRLP